MLVLHLSGPNISVLMDVSEEVIERDRKICSVKLEPKTHRAKCLTLRILSPLRVMPRCWSAYWVLQAIPIGHVQSQFFLSNCSNVEIILVVGIPVKRARLSLNY